VTNEFKTNNKVPEETPVTHLFKGLKNEEKQHKMKVDTMELGQKRLRDN